MKKEVYSIKPPKTSRRLKCVKTGLNQHPMNNLVEVVIIRGALQGLKFFIDKRYLEKERL